MPLRWWPQSKRDKSLWTHHLGKLQSFPFVTITPKKEVTQHSCDMRGQLRWNKCDDTNEPQIKKGSVAQQPHHNSASHLVTSGVILERCVFLTKHSLGHHDLDTLICVNSPLHYMYLSYPNPRPRRFIEIIILGQYSIFSLSKSQCSIFSDFNAVQWPIITVLPRH